MSEMPAREQMISAYSELVGLDLVSLGDGVAEVRLPMAAHLRNRGGVMHGGALFSLMDVTMGLACSSSHGFDRQSVTLECKINYIRAVADGEVLRRPRPPCRAPQPGGGSRGAARRQASRERTRHLRPVVNRRGRHAAEWRATAIPIRAGRPPRRLPPKARRPAPGRSENAFTSSLL